MTKLKHKLASLLTATMMLTSMSTNVFADAIPETANGTYTADTLSIYITSSTSTSSVSDTTCSTEGIFSTEAEVIIKGDTATIIMYVCNPILTKEEYQSWFGEYYCNEDGILQDIYVMDESKTGEQYNGTIEVGYGNPDAPIKYFGNYMDYGPSYVEADSYLPCDVLTIPNVPVKILENERFLLNGYFTYGDVDKEYYVGITYGDYTLDPVGDDETTTTHTTTISATVTAEENTPEYSVIIPESISLGELDSSKDNTLEYSIEVSKMQSLTSVSVECEDTGNLKLVNSTNSSKTIDYTNVFNKATVTETGSIKGTITVAQGDVISADEGSYSGTINFKVVAE